MAKTDFNMTPVSSANLTAVGYNEEKKLLRVSFKSGSTYEYRGVGKDIFDDLMAADSKGTYFAANIRNDYPYSKV